jgi:hypothetical protein
MCGRRCPFVGTVEFFKTPAPPHVNSDESSDIPERHHDDVGGPITGAICTKLRMILPTSPKTWTACGSPLWPVDGTRSSVFGNGKNCPKCLSFSRLSRRTSETGNHLPKTSSSITPETAIRSPQRSRWARFRFAPLGGWLERCETHRRLPRRLITIGLSKTPQTVKTRPLFSSEVHRWHVRFGLSANTLRSHRDVRFTPENCRASSLTRCPLRAICGRLLVGKVYFTSAALVGAAMCSAFECGSHDRWP